MKMIFSILQNNENKKKFENSFVGEIFGVTRLNEIDKNVKRIYQIYSSFIIFINQ